MTVRRPYLTEPDSVAKILKAADRLSHLAAKRGIKLPRAAARERLYRKVGEGWADDPDDPLSVLMTTHNLRAEAESAIEETVRAGREKGGKRAAQEVRKKWQKKAREWWRRAEKMGPHLSLTAKAEVIARNSGLPNAGPVFEALRRYRPTGPRRKRT